MSLLCTSLCAINQANALTLRETFDLHKNLVRWKETKFDILDKKKNDFNENKSKQKSAHAFASGTYGNKCM